MMYKSGPNVQRLLRLQRFYPLILCIGALSGVSNSNNDHEHAHGCSLSAVSLALICHSKLTVGVDSSSVMTMWNECFVKVWIFKIGKVLTFCFYLCSIMRR